jgi:hypothetical protein
LNLIGFSNQAKDLNPKTKDFHNVFSHWSLVFSFVGTNNYATAIKPKTNRQRLGLETGSKDQILFTVAFPLDTFI